ncbi:hypothetical protein DICVIV_08459 [Dictyocaulus viviparus]|uniref:Uncharacterized protein n=1 Tax=Dictyocaulus viviparus TaxID=29172 RepID=A0A0D8XP12_DICVI|nr:hypothetical protein DICVIV_08459 [Dictyocaulus viviparus]
MSVADEDFQLDADIENNHMLCTRKRTRCNGEIDHINKFMRVSMNSALNNRKLSGAYSEVAGRIAGVEIENFMCHGHIKIDFDTTNNNCFYIGGPNGKVGTLDHLRIHYCEVVDLFLFTLFVSFLVKLKSDSCSRIESVRLLRLIRPIFLKLYLELEKIEEVGQFVHYRFIRDFECFEPIFMCATELEHTKTCYDHCEAITTAVETICKSMKEEFERMKRKYQIMVEQRQQLRNINDMRIQQSEIGWMLLWCPLRDVNEEIHIFERKKDKFKCELNHVDRRVEESMEKINVCSISFVFLCYVKYSLEISSLQSRIDAEMEELSNLNVEITERKINIGNVKNEMTNDNAELRRLECNRTSYEKRRDLLKEQIAKFEEECQSEKRKKEASQTKLKLDKITQKESKVIECLRLAQQERDELQKVHEQVASHYEQVD